MDIITEIKIDDEFSNIFIIRSYIDNEFMKEECFINTVELYYFFKNCNVDDLKENDILFYSDFSEEEHYDFKINILEKDERENLIYLDIVY